MTTDTIDRAEANAVVALAVGFWWYSKAYTGEEPRRFIALPEQAAELGGVECTDDVPLFSDWDKYLPDLWAATPEGASWREIVRRWLLSIPVTILGDHFAEYDPLIMLWSERTYQGGTKDDFGFCVEYNPHRKLKNVYGLGSTIEEATANAIYHAIRAMEWDGDG